MDTPKILIVDDDDTSVGFLEQELKGSHYDTIKTVNGREMLELVHSAAPDLILFDIMMPGIDGFEVLTSLKADPSTRDIPVIIITSCDDLDCVVDGIQLGAEDYLPKPFKSVLLHARISSCLEKKRLRDLQQAYLKGLERELEIGREIQQGFLPSELPQMKGWEIEAYLKPAQEVAGDYYDAFLLPDEILVFVVGDVCSKGVGAALYMALFRSLIRIMSAAGSFPAVLVTDALQPAERLLQTITFINKYIAETHGDAGMFTALFLGVINLLEGTLTYTNCGIEPPLLFSEDGTVTRLQPTGPVVGVFSDAKFSVRSVSMANHDILLAFTDGVPDALNLAGQSFGNERLLKLLNGSRSPHSLVNEVKKELDRFIGPADPFDDIAMLAIRRNAGPAVFR